VANHSLLTEAFSPESEVLGLSVHFDRYFFNGVPTQVHFVRNSSIVGTWIDDHGVANLSVGLDRIQTMNADQLTFLIAHEYGHLVLKHPEKSLAIQKQFGVSSTFDEFMLSFDLKREYSKQMREMELQADQFATSLLMSLGRDPVIGASFLLSEAKSIQHPEGTLRVSKIKQTKEMLSHQDSASNNKFTFPVGESGQLMAGLPDGREIVFEPGQTFVKAVVESKPQQTGGFDFPVGMVSSFEVSALLTLAVLACAAPSWWRKVSFR
jgi:hypothetical protein